MKKILLTILASCLFLTACEQDPRKIKIGDRELMSKYQNEIMSALSEEERHLFGRYLWHKGPFADPNLTVQEAIEKQRLDEQQGK